VPNFFSSEKSLLDWRKRRRNLSDYIDFLSLWCPIISPPHCLDSYVSNRISVPDYWFCKIENVYFACRRKATLLVTALSPESISVPVTIRRPHTSSRAGATVHVTDPKVKMIESYSYLAKKITRKAQSSSVGVSGTQEEKSPRTKRPARRCDCDDGQVRWRLLQLWCSSRSGAPATSCRCSSPASACSSTAAAAPSPSRCW
jgi:hypothetical protein